MKHRRNFLQSSAFAAAAFTTRGLFAELVSTARLTEGPFYPDKLPLDTDNDLLVINDSLTPAVGEITHLSGRILSASGEPLRNAFVEIWQVDGNGAYIHSADAAGGRNDKNFQGYGRFLTDASGTYYFRTVKPVPYPGRTPHIHVAVSKNGKRIVTTQLLINGHPQNERDGVFRAVRDEAERKSILVDFKPIPDSEIGGLAANFDVVLGRTYREAEKGEKPSGIAPKEWNSEGPRGGRPRNR
jgi:protocatechuate 3,4-dioxygenase, beta subunit